MGQDLAEVLEALEGIAPLELAEPWDNVGLLLEPPRLSEVRKILLTVDFTDAVLAEARRMGVHLVLSYHPPIFEPLRRLTQAEARQRILIETLEARIAVYSPHTALDCVEGGVNDWLAEGLGEGQVESLEPWRGAETEGPGSHPGQGRVVELPEPRSMDTLIRRVKDHLGLLELRDARAPKHEKGEKIRKVLLCSGAGSSVLSDRPGDLYFTGEMKHHEVLAALGRGTSVLLAGHSNSERGYMPRLRKRLLERLGSTIEVLVSEEDRDPLQTR